MLAHFDCTKTYYVKTNASNYVTLGVLSQYSNDRLLYPIAFFSKKIVLVECNYKIYNKELLVII